MSRLDRGMSPLAVLVLLQVTVTVFGGKHSLTYIYTAFSHEPVGLPGLHEFTAMGMLDGQMIDYFDSDKKVKVPKQPWMMERLPDDYWVKGTQSRKYKQQWFKVNIGILMERMKQNKTATDQHVLQWMHGCEGEKQPDGTLKFTSGIDTFSYDGRDFLSFDVSNSAWVAGVTEAEQTKRTWDGVDVEKESLKGYLEKECMEWMEKFLKYQEKQLKAAKKPDVHLFAMNAKKDAHTVLNCFATGFYPKNITLLVRRNGRVLSKEDGVESSGSRPNGDGTFQRRDSVEILKTDESRYTCQVIHEESEVNVQKEWERLPPISIGPIGLIGLIIEGVLSLLVVLLVAGVLFFLYRKGAASTSIRFRAVGSTSSGSNSTGSTSSGTGSNGSMTSVGTNRAPEENPEASPLAPPATEAD
ncbi:BOLA class I histocompatibility antigen, alpha chain BL3-7-like isoform X2 [Pungitius pungitius]|uniref:BOLA class I histocompatibility antigen, alpha chain BL3-7-like isoform X2 n=1 Tax=Pungitius pungitius TaxID=134920 RepID=UPI002E13AFF8